MVDREKVIDALRQCNDPELELNVWFLGLIYDIGIDGDNVRIKMTFTTPFCPYGQSLIDLVKTKVKEIAGATDVQVELVFEPKWEPSEDVNLALGL